MRNEEEETIKVIKKIDNKFNDPLVRKANVILGRILRIIDLNDSNGEVDPDAPENSNNSDFINTGRSVKPEDVRKEMINLAELFTALENIVENIENFEIQMKFEEAIDVLGWTRKRIRNENRTKVEFRNNENSLVFEPEENAENGSPAIKTADLLIIKGGGKLVPVDWR